MLRPFRYFADQYEGNPEPDLEAYAKAGHVIYAHKASEGGGHVDTAHARRVRHAHALGLTVVHYHYCKPEPTKPHGTETVLFWLTVKPTFVKGDYLALDFESLGRVGPAGAAIYLENAHSELRRLSGHDALIYGSTSFLAEHTRRVWLQRHRRWQAQYGSNPGMGLWRRPWWAWQMNDGQVGPEPHRLAGIPNGDVNMARLDVALAAKVRTARRRRRVLK